MSGIFDVLVGKTVSGVEYVDDFEGGITLRFTDGSYLGVSMNLRESCLDVAASIETYDVGAELALVRTEKCSCGYEVKVVVGEPCRCPACGMY